MESLNAFTVFFACARVGVTPHSSSVSNLNVFPFRRAFLGYAVLWGTPVPVCDHHLREKVASVCCTFTHEVEEGDVPPSCTLCSNNADRKLRQDCPYRL